MLDVGLHRPALYFFVTDELTGPVGKVSRSRCELGEVLLGGLGGLPDILLPLAVVKIN